MKLESIQRAGGLSIMLGALLTAFYAVAFPVLFKVQGSSYDMAALVMNPHWVWVATVAMAGIILMLFGFMAVYSRMAQTSGIVGFLGFLFLEIAYLLQACKVTWEIFIYPVLVKNSATVFLLRERVFKTDPQAAPFFTISRITIILGMCLFCFALVRSRAYPKAAGLLIFIGALAYALGPVVSVFVGLGGIFTLSLGCLLLGVRLMQRGV